MDQRKLPDEFRAGDTLKAEQLNAMLDVLRRNLSAAAPLQIIHGAEGIIIALGRPFPRIPRKGIGKANETIANRAAGDISIWEGPLGSESDTTDDEEMFNLGPEVESGDWVVWEEILPGELAFTKLCS